jgi:hypothetical protein
MRFLFSVLRHVYVPLRSPTKATKLNNQWQVAKQILGAAQIWFYNHSSLQIFDLCTELIMSSTLILLKLIVAQLVKKFSVFYGTTSFTTVFTRACYQARSQARWTHSKLKYHAPFLLVRSCRRTRSQDMLNFSIVFWNFILVSCPLPIRQGTTPGNHETPAVHNYLLRSCECADSATSTTWGQGMVKWDSFNMDPIGFSETYRC